MRYSDLSAVVRATLIPYPAPHSNHRGVVPMAPSRGSIPIGGAEVGALLHEANAALVRMTEYVRPGLSAFALTRILERQEALTSSSIEGTHGTLDALLAGEADGETEGDIREIGGVTQAISQGLDVISKMGRDGFTLDLVCDLHRILASNMERYRDTPGVLRNRVVWIGPIGPTPDNSSWNPPPPDRVAACLEDTLAYMRADVEDPSQVSPIVRAAVAHAHFEAVHPFSDGNGRIGRILIPLMFAAEGHAPVYISPWIEAADHKQAYFAALKAAQQRLDHGPLVRLISEAILGIEAEFKVTMKAIATIEAGWRERITLRRSSAADRTLRLLPAYPVLTAKTLAQLLDVSFKSANDGIGQLEKAGVLTLRKAQSRNRVFQSREILKVLTRPFGSDPFDQDTV